MLHRSKTPRWQPKTGYDKTGYYNESFTVQKEEGDFVVGEIVASHVEGDVMSRETLTMSKNLLNHFFELQNDHN